MWDRELPGQGQKIRASLFAAGMRGSANLACACVRGLLLAGEVGQGKEHPNTIFKHQRANEHLRQPKD